MKSICTGVTAQATLNPQTMKKHTFILSDESVNCYGYKTKTSGIDLTEFKANPVMFFNHNSDMVIGNWDNIRVENDQLKADAVFDEDDEFAMSIANKVEKGIIKGCSIGFSIKRIETGYSSDPDVITESVLKECSICAIPANKNALRLYDNAGKQIHESEVLTFLSAFKPQSTKPMKEFKMTLALIMLLTLSADASPEAIEQRITEMANENARLKTENATLADQVKVANEAKVKQLIDDSISQKKISEGEREAYAQLAAKDYDNTKKALDARAPVGKVTEAITPGPGKTELSAERAGWTIREWEKKDAKGLLKLKASDPDAYKALFEAAYGEVVVPAEQK